MAEFTHIDLRAARESRKMPRWKLAAELGYSEDVIRRWETGEQRPDPDDVGNIERMLKTPGIWHRWMMSHYDSYRERHGDVPCVEHLSIDLSRLRLDMDDVEKLLPYVERDALDGQLDDPQLRKDFRDKALRTAATIQHIADRIPTE